MKKVAVLDLGTNTFNLVLAVADQKSQKFTIKKVSKLPVKIGEGGFTAGLITKEAFNRGIDAIEKHVSAINRFEPDDLVAFGTSALRSTSNSGAFIQAIKDRFNVQVEVISGEHEAALIFKAIQEAVKWEGIALTMDIGGGSTEFTIASKTGLYYAQSFDLGVSRLKQALHFSEPAKPVEIETLNEYLKKGLRDLLDAVKMYPPLVLIGSAGTFDSIASIDSFNKHNRDKPEVAFQYNLPAADFFPIHYKLVNSNYRERLQIKGLPGFRADMIVIGSLMVNFILEKTNIEQVIQSGYSLKEGILINYLKELQHG